MAGHSYRTGTPKPLHFGLGDAATVSEMEIRWPSGQVTTMGPFAADRYITVQE
ncbi:MAG: ASPIC/UnbV domain-containing protein [Planctomycetota bacterium]